MTQPASHTAATPLRIRLVPPPANTLLGREHVCATLMERLYQPGCRLLTLVGPGGIGKSSLALQIANRAASPDSPFVDGVAVVYLAALTAVAEVPLAIADTLHVPLQGVRPALDQIGTLLRDQQLLLVLDNLEQLLGPENGDALTAFVGRLLAEAPGVRVLATSRERLRIRAEEVLELDGLDLPPADSEQRAEQSPAIQLFLTHARRVAPDFSLDRARRRAVIGICRRLEGSPLAIELAAAWTHALTVEEIAAEIDRALDFLVLADRDIPLRQRSMRAVLDHSWGLLDAAERRILARLAVFHGGCDRAAAIQVTGASLPVLSTLIDKSLLQHTEVRGTTRYTLHELVRQYAAERLSDAPEDQAATEARHAAYYAALLQRHIEGRTGAMTAEARALLNREIDNLRLVWGRAAAQCDIEVLSKMVRGFWILYEANSWFLDGVDFFGLAAEALRGAENPNAAGLRGYLMVQQGGFLGRAGRFAHADPLLEEGMALVQANNMVLREDDLMYHLGMVELHQGRIEVAHKLLERGATAAKAAGDDFVQLWTELFLGKIACFNGDYQSAEATYQRCVSAWHAQNFARGEAFALIYAGDLARMSGQYETAAARLATALRIASNANDRWILGLTLGVLGAVATDRSDLDAAYYLLTEGSAIARELGEQWTLGAIVCGFGHLMQMRGGIREAQQCYAETAQIIRGGEIILIDELIYGLAMLYDRAGDIPTARALLGSLTAVAASHDTLRRASTLQAQIEQRHGATPHLEAIPQSQPALLAWLTELTTRPLELPAAPSKPDLPIVPIGSLLIPETGEILSPREIEVLRLLVAGASNPAIADTLVLSRFTVKHHVASILQKLAVATRTQAALRGRALGLEPLSPR